MADLLTEAKAPAPKFAAVVCEDIERSGRDTFNALKLEKELSRQGIPLFATDEPASIEGINATTVLVPRVKQGVAEWYRLQRRDTPARGLTAGPFVRAGRARPAVTRRASGAFFSCAAEVRR
jgi:DNA invertase Pin-like site-specific DNA recombinase